DLGDKTWPKSSACGDRPEQPRAAPRSPRPLRFRTPVPPRASDVRAAEREIGFGAGNNSEQPRGILREGLADHGSLAALSTGARDPRARPRPQPPRCGAKPDESRRSLSNRGLVQQGRDRALAGNFDSGRHVWKRERAPAAAA